MKLGKYGRFIMSLFGRRFKGSGDQSGLLQEQLFWLFCFASFAARLTWWVHPRLFGVFRVFDDSCSIESDVSFQVRPSILHLFSPLITFIRRNPRYLPSTLLPSTSSTLQVALLSTLLTVATPIAQAVRTTARRGAVTGLLSQVERQPEVKSRRGWEKTSGL